MQNVSGLEIYNNSETVLRKIAKFYGANETDLDEYFEPNNIDKLKMADVFMGFARALQNGSNITLGIDWKKEIEAKDGMVNKICCNFDLNEFCAKYKSVDNKGTLLNEFRSKGLIKKNEKSWANYSEGLITGANKLSQFTEDNFIDYFRNPGKDELENFYKDIKHFKFALTCDFLKELGFTEYGKPDIHIMWLFKAFGLIQPCKSEQWVAFEKIREIAKEAEATPYKVDKVFWLLASGNFYNHKWDNNDNKSGKVVKLSEREIIAAMSAPDDIKSFYKWIKKDKEQI